MISLWVAGNQKICLCFICNHTTSRFSPNACSVIIVPVSILLKILGVALGSHGEMQTPNQILSGACDALLLCNATWSGFSESHNHCSHLDEVCLIPSAAPVTSAMPQEAGGPSPGHCRITLQSSWWLFPPIHSEVTDEHIYMMLNKIQNEAIEGRLWLARRSAGSAVNALVRGSPPFSPVFAGAASASLF